MSMVGAVVVSGCAGRKITFVALSVRPHHGALLVGLRVGNSSTVICVLQIYDGCRFHFFLGFNVAHVEQPQSVR